MFDFEDHWDGWLRSALTVGIPALVGLAWYLGWLPDGVVGWPLLVACLLVPTAVVVVRSRGLRAPRALRAGLIVVALLAGLVAASAPAVLIGPRGLVAEAELERGQPLTVPPQTPGEEELVAYVHGSPTHSAARSRVHLELAAGQGEALTHEGLFEDGWKHGRRKTNNVSRHDIIWHLHADLGQGAQLLVDAPDHDMAWPLHAELRRAPPSEHTLALFGGPLLALALLLDALGQRWGRTWLVSLALGALTFAFLFGRWFAPGTLTKTAFGAGFAALVVGGIGGGALAWLVGRPFRLRRAAAAGPPRSPTPG